ncbi:DUF397 domain-containing protein [Streptomyces huiliensis]|uniref:DUF397 domain-containing protein n=1 Tax=Streptomyces huiliensis TaxID=2876027 RepID=UPI001CBE416E|nr:DUF397 domain-containing protein [Streptomyces huiliensis]MBZ4321040.1 DUF397 domain-containing protein [Streptomyces huiliensis]
MNLASRIPSSAWRKSSYSTPDAAGECVEVAYRIGTSIPVRDSKRPYGPHLAVPAPAWAAFIDAVRGQALRTRERATLLQRAN